MRDAIIVEAVRTPSAQASQPGRSPAFTRSTASAGDVRPALGADLTASTQLRR